MGTIYVDIARGDDSYSHREADEVRASFRGPDGPRGSSSVYVTIKDGTVTVTGAGTFLALESVNGGFVIRAASPEGLRP